ncbi:butyrophilin subfamily 3 member A3-like [Malaclemys terrapin pileata]|uniref:butyrophilin subfamily 3 member A3-like n=1 Tax=Malaclemys terrapin pileata TaxID=2991368 RepID=UPI0023A8EFE7|nr:butyrophilin subfamily 3 member A3-like [Malaclemys terrapin pileata]
MELQGQLSSCLFCAILLAAIPFSVSFEVISSPTVTGIIGQDVVLPCQISTRMQLDNMEVQWKKINQAHIEIVHEYRAQTGQDVPGPNYQGRTVLLKDGFTTGNVSLKLKNVQPADRGMYNCIVKSNKWSADAATELQIAAVASVSIDVLGPQGQGIDLACRSEGWFPKPELHWVTKNGQDLQPVTKTEQGRELLFSALSHVTILGEETGEIGCVIQNSLVCNGLWLRCYIKSLTECLLKLASRGMFGPGDNDDQGPGDDDDQGPGDDDDQGDLQEKLNQLKTEKEKLEKENDQFKNDKGDLQEKLNQLKTEKEKLEKENDQFKNDKGDLQEKLNQLKTEKEKLEKENDQFKNDKGDLQEKLNQLKTEKDKLETENDNITLDTGTAHPNLSIDRQKKNLKHEAQPQQVPPNPERFDSTVCVLGSEGFSDGKHYWEVDVGSSTDWDLGVARKSIQRKGKLSLSPKEGFWVLGLSGRDYWAKTDPWTRVMVQKKPKKIGVYLNYQQREVTFLIVTDMSVLFTFNDCSFSGEVYPFFKNSHKETTMRICS